MLRFVPARAAFEVKLHYSRLLQWEDVGHVPRDLWKSAGENGLLGVTMPEQYGGAAADKLYAAITWEEQVREN
jgi:alkylation response protein AidB-like acyl-CoA dehydrogenase